MVDSTKSAPSGAAKTSARGYPVFSFVVRVDGLPPIAVRVSA